MRASLQSSSLPQLAPTQCPAHEQLTGVGVGVGELPEPPPEDGLPEPGLVVGLPDVGIETGNGVTGGYGVTGAEGKEASAGPAGVLAPGVAPGTMLA